MAKRCPEEFNPWPPFVDIFASVILVMLLFLLITIVNIGYYAQFKFKTSYSASTTVKEPILTEEQSKVTTTPKECNLIVNKENAVSFHKIIAPSYENANNSLFSGGEKEGNAVSYAVNKNPKEFTNQKIKKNNLELLISFEDKEIFLNPTVKRKIKLFVGRIKRRSDRAVFTLYIHDPQKIISSTMAKRISLGRVINVKNILKHSRIKVSNIKMNLREDISSSNSYGDVLIKAYIP